MTRLPKAGGRLRIATGPFRPAVTETRAAWEPLVRYLGERLGVEATLTICESWQALGDAMVRDEYDAAWMGGGFRYVQARAQGAGPAIATVTVAGLPQCHAIVIAGREVPVSNFPHDARGLSIAFTHVESTTGWLMVYAGLVAQDIVPEAYFRYSAGNQHAANEFAVARGQSDLATDSESNRRSMVERGLVEEADVRIVWRSRPLPLDPISISNTLEPLLAARLQRVLIDIDAAAACAIPMPPGYTGFVAASDETYGTIREAALSVGRLPRAAALANRVTV